MMEDKKVNLNREMKMLFGGRGGKKKREWIDRGRVSKRQRILSHSSSSLLTGLEEIRVIKEKFRWKNWKL